MTAFGNAALLPQTRVESNRNFAMPGYRPALNKGRGGRGDGVLAWGDVDVVQFAAGLERQGAGGCLTLERNSGIS